MNDCSRHSVYTVYAQNFDWARYVTVRCCFEFPVGGIYLRGRGACTATDNHTNYPCPTSGQVRYWVIRRSSESPRPPCDGNPSASVWPSRRQTPGPSCPYPSNRPPPDATMKRVGAPWYGPVPRISTRKNPMGGILHRRSLKNGAV